MKQTAEKTADNVEPGQNNVTLLHENASAATLVFFVKFFFAIWLFRYLFDPIYGLSQLPLGYAEPVGWVRLFPVWAYEAIHSAFGLALLKISIIGCCVGVWFPRLRMRCAITGCFLLTTANAITRGFGHVNHAEIGPLLLTWILTIFMVRMGASLTSRPTHEKNSTAATGLIMSTLALGLVYAFVGIARLFNGGPEFFLGDSIQTHLLTKAHTDWIVDFNISRLIFAYPWVITALQIGTLAVTIAEILVPLAVVSRRVRWGLLLLLPGFHLGAILMFKVLFVEQMLALILLVNVTPWLQARAQHRAADLPDNRESDLSEVAVA